VSLMHPDGPVGVARAALARDTISVLSAAAGTPPDEVRAHVTGPLWFQLYAYQGQDVAQALAAEVQELGYGGLVVTMDTSLIGNRERDSRHGIGFPLRIRPNNVMRLGPQLLARPRWSSRLAIDGIRTMRSSGPLPGMAPAPRPKGAPTPLRTPRTRRSMGSPFSWADVEALRARWEGPLFVKGLLIPEDARRAVDVGADGVIVSNHGGRQLEGAPATFRALPGIVDAVGGQAEVLLDGGVRRGTDVLKAVALGARAVLIGRPYLWGLSAGGQAGVERIIDLFRDEMTRAMVLMGCPAVKTLDRDWVQSAGGVAVPQR
jgi:L-lactate dehydrogenase (cytochrome)